MNPRNAVQRLFARSDEPQPGGMKWSRVGEATSHKASWLVIAATAATRRIEIEPGILCISYTNHKNEDIF